CRRGRRAGGARAALDLRADGHPGTAVGSSALLRAAHRPPDQSVAWRRCPDRRRPVQAGVEAEMTEALLIAFGLAIGVAVTLLVRRRGGEEPDRSGRRIL